MFPDFFTGVWVEAEEVFLDVLGWIVTKLVIGEEVETVIVDDGSSTSIGLVLPKLAFAPGFPGVGEINFGGGAVLGRAAPVGPVFGGKQGGEEDENECEFHGDERFLAEA